MGEVKMFERDLSFSNPSLGTSDTYSTVTYDYVTPNIMTITGDNGGLLMSVNNDGVWTNETEQLQIDIMSLQDEIADLRMVVEELQRLHG